MHENAFLASFPSQSFTAVFELKYFAGGYVESFGAYY